jgi:flagellar basal-body rod protein FlgB
MRIGRLFTRGPIAALQTTLRFAHARHRVLAHNLANIDTPGFRTLQLCKTEFQSALREAIEQQRASVNQDGALQVPSTGQFRMGDNGQLEFTPEEASPPQNILFQDQTNHRLEQILADVADNNALFQFAVTMLGQRLNGLRTAIRGRLV